MDDNLQSVIDFTGNHKLYGRAMRKVIDNWPYSCDNFLSNSSINKKAYLGHAAVCLELGVPEYITRLAWSYLSDEQQILANNEAIKNIKLWAQRKKLKNI